MKNFLPTLILALVCFCQSLKASDHYSVGDQLYVWALNGLKIRESASAGSNAVSTALYRQRVTILGKTIVKYSLTLISSVDNSSPEYTGSPVKLEGNWVQIVTEKNDTGYVIDQYLLHLKPQKNSAENNLIQQLNVMSADTLFKTEDFDGESLQLKISYTLDKKIKCLMQTGGVWTNVKYTFPKFSLEEVLIILAAAYNNFEGISVSQNKKNSIELTDELNCRYILTFKGDTVTLEELCAC